MYRLLIADNDPGSLQTTQSLLDWSAYGFDLVMTAHSYASAVSIALDRKPHVILVSFHLGEHRGYELAVQLHSMEIPCTVCILAPDKDPDEILCAMRAGARDFLPVTPDAIGQFLERIVSEELGGTLPENPIPHTRIDPVLQVPYTALSKITNKTILLVKSGYSNPQTLTSIADNLPI